MGKDASPTCRFATSPEVGPGATVGTLQTGYPPHTSSKPRQEAGRATTCPAVLDPASLHGRAPTLPCDPQLQALLPCSGGLQRCHASRGSKPCRPTREGSSVTLLRRALVLPCVPRHRACLPAREGSSTATCPTTIRGG
jgi:hypothetical protein